MPRTALTLTGAVCRHAINRGRNRKELFHERGRREKSMFRFSALFRFWDPSQVELFFGRFHPSILLTTSRPLRVVLLVALPDARRPPLENFSSTSLQDSTGGVFCGVN